MRRASLAALLASLVLAGTSGCRRGPGAEGRAPLIAARYRRTERQLEAQSGCDDVQSIRAIRPRVLSVRGCGEQREVVVEPDFTVAHAVAPVETLAARELACPEGAVEITRPSPTTRGAAGCGRRARYDLICDEALWACAWAMTAHAGDWEGAAPTVVPVPPITPAGYTSVPSLDDVVLPPPPAESVLPTE
ncbi:MAG: hypothetical protein U0234_21795 [Sandaracinus sp.]